MATNSALGTTSRGYPISLESSVIVVSRVSSAASGPPCCSCASLGAGAGQIDAVWSAAAWSARRRRAAPRRSGCAARCWSRSSGRPSGSAPGPGSGPNDRRPLGPAPTGWSRRQGRNRTGPGLPPWVRRGTDSQVFLVPASATPPEPAQLVSNSCSLCASTRSISVV